LIKWTAREVRVEALERAIVEWENAVLGGFDQEKPLQLGQLLWILLGKILRLGPVRVRVVQLPDVVVEGALVGTDPWDAVVRQVQDPNATRK
jgi:predicted Zn-dependent protease